MGPHPTKKSLLSQNNLPLAGKTKFKTLKNQLQIWIPRPRKPSVKFYKKKQLFSQNKPSLTKTIKLENFEKSSIDSDFSTSKTFEQTL